MSSENRAPKDRHGDQGLGLRWVKPPRQDRSKDTQDRLIDAAERLLSRGRSWASISVAGLVKEAGTSVGAFYNRFRDKDALLHVLQIQLHEEGEATAAQASALGGAVTVPFEALIRAFVSLAVGTYRAQWGLRRALLGQMMVDEQFRDRAIELAQKTCEGMTNVLVARFPKQERAKLATFVDVAHRMVYGLLDQNLLFGDRATGRMLDDDTLTDELSAAVLAYLQHRVR
ncbi:MAG: TetR/AcrR family transcriptional regulator [Myxococcota bacterium]|nr:TetR/AcrR family transcriptional regulator [Deltaproteobacteria bacterium]MDQ3337762.1 TetR/AcrR family transcriptional regulator [Myxococcota bacterium]